MITVNEKDLATTDTADVVFYEFNGDETVNLYTLADSKGFAEYMTNLKNGKYQENEVAYLNTVKEQIDFNGDKIRITKDFENELISAENTGRNIVNITVAGGIKKFNRADLRLMLKLIAETKQDLITRVLDNRAKIKAATTIEEINLIKW